MLSANPFSSRFITTAFVAAAIAAFGLSVRAQDNASHQTPYVDDWSHHHMVFSNPGTRDDAVKNNKLDQWQKVNNDLRYQLQQGKRNVGTRPVVVDGSDRNGNDHSRDGSKDHGKGAKPGKGTASDLTRDWSQVLGGGTSVIGTVTSLTSGNITGGTSGVSMDGVTFLASPPTPETQTGVISGGTPGGTIVIKNSTGPNTLTLSAAGGGGLTRQNASFSGDPTAGSTITVGSRTYTWVSGAATSANQITSGTGGANDNAQNFYAALLGNPAECYDAGCITSSTTVNTQAIGLWPGYGGYPVVTVYNTTSSTINFSTTSSVVAVTGGGTIAAAAGATNGCSSSSTGTFVNPSIATAGNSLAVAISACNASFPAVGVTAVSNGGVASNTVTVSAAVPGTTGGSTITLGGTLNNFAWNGTTLTGGSNGTADTTHFPYWSGNTYASASQVATNIATAINSNATVNPLITASPNLPASGEITFTKLLNASSYTVAPVSFGAFTVTGGGTLSGGVQAAVQPNALPAKWGPSLTTASCANDFVIYPTGQAGVSGTPGAATIVAYNNVYSSCTGTVPQVYWAYDTGAGSYVTTSPVTSLDGTQVAFIQSTGSVASLVLLRWAQGTNSSPIAPVVPATATAADYEAGCVTAGLPCMYIIPFANGKNDTMSSPYYDFGTTNLIYDDAIYVGDDAGNLHKFTGVFRGLPAELIPTSPSNWPVSLGASELASPVYDDNSGYVFVGDMAGTLHSVTAAGVAHGTAALATGAIADAPLIDGTLGTVYAFVDTATANTVYELSTGFTSATGANTAALGTGLAGYYLYAGSFDNVYEQSTLGTGTLWTVGNTGATSGGVLYGATIAAGILTGVVPTTVTVTAAAHPWPSPLTEFCNGTCTTNGLITNGGGTDYVFFSVNQGTGTGCTSSAAGTGCIEAYNVNNPTAPILVGGQNYVTPGTNGCWATGGIVIDNSDDSTGGAADIYFVDLNGADAGNPSGVLSSSCTAGTALTIDAIQAQQSAP